MIPLQVTLEGFLSYNKRQVINFTGASIWALSGPNSVGKSAVFDAMTFALYHCARCDPKDLIHHRADKLIVTFDFMVDSTVYRIKRIHPLKGRSTREVFLVDNVDECNLDDAPTKRIPHLDSESELQEWVKRTIGMDYKAFTTSCLLLQGKSEQLLDAKPAARREILAELMDLSRYEKLHWAADEKRKAFKNALETLENQLLAPSVRIVPDEELEGAQTFLQKAEEIWEKSQESVTHFSVYLEQARNWEKDGGELQKQRQELQRVQTLVDREAEIASNFCQLQELERVVPLLKQIIEERQALQILQARLGELQGQTYRIQEDIRVAEGKKQIDQQVVKNLETTINEIERQSKYVLSRLTILIPVVNRLETIEQLHRRRESIEKDIAQLPSDIGWQMTQAEERLQELEDMERVLPWLCEFAKARAGLATALKREQATSEHMSALHLEHDNLKKNYKILEDVCSSASDNERRLDGEKRNYNNQLREARSRLQNFLGVATKPVCDLCGQKITGEHAKQEQVRLQQLVEECRHEVELVTAQHRDAVSLKTAREQDLKELVKKIEEVKEAHVRAKGERQTACEQAKNYEVQLCAAFQAMNERYREYISSAMPTDSTAWLATSYPLPSDIETMQQEVKNKDHQEHEIKRIRSLYENWQKLHQRMEVLEQQIGEQEQDIDLDAARKVRIEKNDIQEQQDKLTNYSEKQRRKLEQAKKAAQETENRLVDLHEQVQRCEKELGAETARREEKERVQREREGSLPIQWQRQVGTLDKSAVMVLEQKQVDLLYYRSLHEELISAREHIARYQESIDKLEKQILAYPDEAKRSAQEAEGALLARKEEHKRATAERDTARSILRDLEGMRERRRDLEQQKIYNEKMQHLYAILEKHLGKKGLQLFLLNRAERAIVDFANQTLNGLSHGRLHLEWRPNSDGQSRTDKALDVLVRDREIGNCTVSLSAVSGSQKFRIAVSLALAIGRYMSRDGRHPEAVIIDEGFGGLDKAGRDDMIQELHALGAYVARIILVSHQEEFAYAFPNRYRVKLIDGSSRVTLMDEE